MTNDIQTGARWTYPKLLCDYNKDCNCELTVPFPSNKAYLTRDGGATGRDWFIVFEQISPLQSVSGLTPPVVFATVFVKYKNLRPCVITFEGELEGESWFSRAVGYAKKVAVGFLVPYVSPILRVVEKGVEIAQSMGFSRPLVLPAVQMFSAKTALAVMGGAVGGGQTLGSDPNISVNINTSDIPLSRDGETKASNIAKIPGIVSVGMAPGLSMILHPGVCLYTSDATYLIMQMTPISFAMSFFRKFHCTLKVRFTWYSSALIRGRAAIFISPDSRLSVPVSNGTGMITYVEVVGTTSVVVDVPWTYNHEVKDSYYPANALSVAVEPSISWSWVSGPFGPADTLPLIYPTVEYYAEDFVGTIPEIQGPRIAPPYTVEGGLLGEDDDDLLLHTRRRCFNAELDAFDPPGTMSFPSEGVTSFGEPNAYTASGVLNLIGAANYTPAMWLRQAFFGWRGGMVWSLHGRNAGESTAHSWVFEGNVVPGAGELDMPEPHLGYLSVSTGNMYSGSSGMALIDGTTSAEITVPDRRTGKFRPGKVIGNSAMTAAVHCSCVRVYSPELFSLQRVVAFNAGADDFVVGGFLSGPSFRKSLV